MRLKAGLLNTSDQPCNLVYYRQPNKRPRAVGSSRGHEHQPEKEAGVMTILSQPPVQLSFFQGKVCTKCHTWKPLDKFYTDPAMPLGRQSQCKECRRETSRERMRQNRKDPEFQEIERQRSRRYRDVHLDECRERCRRFYASNPEKGKAQAKQWRKENPAKWRAFVKRRKERLAAAGPGWTKEEWQALCEQYENRCICCGRRVRLDADHVIPIARNGTHSIENVQPLCRRCNTAKGTDCTDYRAEAKAV